MASPMCSTSKETLLPPSTFLNQVRSEPSHCCICNQLYSTNIEKSEHCNEINDEQPIESLITTLIECVSGNTVNYYNQVNDTSLTFCKQCATLLENWRIFHDEERKFHVKAETIKAKLTAHMLESQLSRQNVKDDGGISHLARLRQFVHQKYKCKVRLEMTRMEELRKISIASKIRHSSLRKSIPTCNFEQGVLICKECSQKFAGSRAILGMRDHFQEKHAGTQSRSTSDAIGNKISPTTECRTNSPSKTTVGRTDVAVQVDTKDFLGYIKKDEAHDESDADDSMSFDLKPDVTVPEKANDLESPQSVQIKPDGDTENATTSFSIYQCTNQLPKLSGKSSSDSLGTEDSNPQKTWVDEIAPGKYNYGGYLVTLIDGKYYCCACSKGFTVKEHAFRHIDITHIGLKIQNVHVQNSGAGKFMYRRQVPFFRKDGIYSCGLCAFHEEQKHSAQPSKTFFTHLSVEHLRNISMDPEERLAPCSDGGFRYSFLGCEVKLKGGMHTCSACHKVFKDKYKCQAHVRDCHASGLFRSCVPPKPRLRPYRIHGFPVEIKGRKYVCVTCSASFRGRLGKRRIMSHIIESHRLQKNAPSKYTEATAVQLENTCLSKIPVKHFYFGVPVDVSEIGEYICGACSTSFRGKYAQFNCKTHIRHTHYREPESSLPPVSPEKGQVILSVLEAERAAQAVVSIPPPEPPSLAELPAASRHDDVNEKLRSLLTQRATMTFQNYLNNPLFLERT